MTDLELFEYNRVKNSMEHFQICDAIEQNYFHRFDTSTTVGGYAKIIADIKWPDDEVKNILLQSDIGNCDRPKAILVTGVVIDIETHETGYKKVWICDNSKLWENPNDYKLLLELAATKESQNCIVAIEIFDDRSQNYTIGSIDNLKPGTRVKMAVFNLSIMKNSTNILKAGFTDIIEYLCEDDNAYKRKNDDYLEYVDGQFKIHGQEDFLKVYCVLAEKMGIGHSQVKKTNDTSAENQHIDNDDCLAMKLLDYSMSGDFMSEGCKTSYSMMCACLNTEETVESILGHLNTLSVNHCECATQDVNNGLLNKITNGIVFRHLLSDEIPLFYKDSAIMFYGKNGILITNKSIYRIRKNYVKKILITELQSIHLTAMLLDDNGCKWRFNNDMDFALDNIGINSEQSGIIMALICLLFKDLKPNKKLKFFNSI